MAFPDDRYYYDWTDDFGTDYRLYFNVGSNEYNAYNSVGSATLNEIQMPKDWLIGVELSAIWDQNKNVNIGNEQPKEFIITWDLNSLDTDISTALFNSSNTTTASGQTFKLHSGNTKYQTLTGEPFEDFQNINFFYENRVIVYIWDGVSEATSTCIFEGVQEINLENDLSQNELDTSFLCIGAKALEMIRPNFRTLNLNYTPATDTFDWSQEEQEHVVLYPARGYRGHDRKHPSYTVAYTGKHFTPEKPSFINFSFSDLFDRIALFAGYLIKAWRRGGNATFIFSSNIFRALTFYKQQSDTDIAGSLSTYGTYDIDTEGVEITSFSDYKFIGLTSSQVTEYDYTGGLLYDDGDFDATKTTWNLINDLLDGLFSKFYFTYTNTTTAGRFTYLDTGHQVKKTLPSRDSYKTLQDSYNYKRISYSTATVPNIEIAEKLGTPTAGDVQVITDATGNKLFDSNDVKCLLHNNQSYYSMSRERETRGSRRYYLMTSGNGWQNGIFVDLTFGSPGKPTDETICLIHDKCKVTKDGTTVVETENTANFKESGLSFSDFYELQKNTTEYTKLFETNGWFEERDNGFNFSGAEQGFFYDATGLRTGANATVGEWERKRNQVAGLAYLMAKASIEWYGVRRHFLKVKVSADLIDVTQLGSQVEFANISNVTFYTESTGNYVMVGYESDLKGYADIDLLEVK